MLNKTRLKVYINAYVTRLRNGESLDKIDEDYLNLRRLNEDDIDQIHKYLSGIDYMYTP